MGESKIRLRILFIFVTLILIILTARLFFIQIIGYEKTQSAYSSQHSSVLEGLNYRGDILDRNGISLVNTEETYIVLLDKIKYDREAAEYLEEVSAETLPLESRRYYGFKTSDFDEEVMNIFRDDYGGYIFADTDRYSKDQPAAHIIGYCNSSENRGAYGLERSCDDKLASDIKLGLIVDGAGRILRGRGIKTLGGKNLAAINTTLDIKIQILAEKALEKYAHSGGAVVIADADTGGILASASYPKFDPGQPDKALGNALINKAVQTSYPPGSIFKIIVAAAALEEDIADPEDVFLCTGKESLYGVEISCSKKEGHGEITFEEAFAGSCNCVFIQLGRKLGREKLIEMAERFGMGEKVLDCLEEEGKGYIADRGQTSGAGIGNLSIGQGETEITCIQAAKISGIIACGGRDPLLYLIEDGGAEKVDEQIISLRTALIIKRMMAKTVNEGTGKRAGADTAGKTGSAQSNLNGEKVVHGWYTGFFPVNDPKYIIAVFTENSGGSSAAVSVFSYINKGIKNLY